MRQDYQTRDLATKEYFSDPDYYFQSLNNFKIFEYFSSDLNERLLVNLEYFRGYKFSF